MNRRQFIETLAAAAVMPAAARQTSANEWGSPVFDLHFHLRQQAALSLAGHLREDRLGERAPAAAGSGLIAA